MSWPWSPHQCPHCRYLAAFDPPRTDDAGFEMPGFCLHPRIGMELFLPKRLDLEQLEPCPLFRARGALRDDLR
jgi:hypothetical protein